MIQKRLSIALAGNPNSGKTTIFNNITGTRQKVGNWPGVTVEKKEGNINKSGYDLKIIDLPGTYSLTPFSIEEIVARNFILDERPDVVIDIIDASNLERSLYLATQLREIDCKVLFALNMADVAQTRGIKIDDKKLSELLAVPVVFTIGNKNKGIETLLKAAIELAESDSVTPKKRKVKYSKDIEDSISKIERFIENHAADSIPYNIRWTAIKLLEDDQIVKERVLEKTGKIGEDILREIDNQRNFLVDRFDDDPEIVMTDERYGFIAGIIMEALTTSTQQRVDISRNVDLVLTNRFIGFPIFIFFIWAMFQLTFTLGAYPMDWISSGINLFSTLLAHVLPDNIFKDFLINGVIAGVGSVMIFLPNILILFFCIALFEDTGYMSRAAFLMDKIMHLIGLHGKSFIPMLMGFGCNVPAIMASRTLESEKDRILTILITPFMSCSARLPVYIILAGAFFGAKAGTVIFGIYLLGIILSIITGRLFRSTLLRGIDAPFVMELPPYRIPMIKSLLIHMWDRSKMFLKKMGGYILAGSVVVWTLTAFPHNISYTKNYDLEIEQVKTYFQTEIEAAQEFDNALLAQKRDIAVAELITEKKAEKAEKSFMGRIGKVVAPIFSPIGIDWRASVALLTGFVAKEIVVSTMGILYAADEREDSEALKNALLSSGMTPSAALAMMVFVLLYMPCVATLAAIRRETASLKWMIFSISYSTLLAWGMAFLVYQGGTMIGV
ncbi:MAG: ferrous iron transport protein B [Desulfobacteraceae bacterium]|nr:ferrous iron transport protein B [Desulfobacteraceae bacterium]MDH3720229.1 ferrous iron transport protein B [Desulfobacteraceae bacterium]MDH3874294.1 ferrous iron transport protein B [Desulfobacteraceae bacterium]